MVQDLQFENVFYLSFIIPIVIFLGVLCFYKKTFSFKLLISFFCKSLISLTLLFALANPYLENKTSNFEIPIFLDVSSSMDNETISELLNETKKLLNKEEVQVVPFASTTKEFEIISNSSDFRKNFDKQELSLTNFEEISKNYPQQSFILLSDGYETNGNIINKIIKNEINVGKIYPIITPSKIIKKEQILLKPLFNPKIYDANKSLKIEFVVENNTASLADETIEVYQNNKLIKKLSSKIPKNRAKNFSFETENLTKGINSFKVVYQDLKFNNPSLDLHITGKEKEKILLISSLRNEENNIKKILSDQTFQVESFVTNGSKLAEDFKFENFQAVILNNVPLNDLTNNFGSKLNDYIKAGGSFLMIGGNKSFGLGGYKDTIFEDLLPVNLLTPEKIQKRVNVALELVLDKSGSMKQRQRMDYTKLAAKSVIAALKEDDYFGIIGFDSQPFIALPITQLKSGGRQKAEQRIQLLFPNGGTNLYPALDAARSELEKAKAGKKHIIILTDGQLPDAAVMSSYYIDLADKLRRIGVTVSVFLIGPDDSKLLNDKFYRSVDANTLPELFLEDVKVNVGEKTQKEFSSYQVKKLRNSKITKISKFPNLLGYVETKIKTNATQELIVQSENDDPLLAYWNYGKGKALAYTSDTTGRWTQNWTSWEGFYQFWQDTMSFLLDSEGKNSFDFDFNYHFEGSNLILNLIVYNKNLKVNDFNAVFSQSAINENIIFSKKNQGLFEGIVNIKQSGDAKIKLTTPDKKDYEFYIPITDFQEVSGQGFNEPFLYQLASVTKGRVNPKSLENITNENSIASKKYFIRELLLLALLLMLADILIRRSRHS